MAQPLPALRGNQGSLHMSPCMLLRQTYWILLLCGGEGIIPSPQKQTFIPIRFTFLGDQGGVVTSFGAVLRANNVT